MCPSAEYGPPLSRTNITTAHTIQTQTQIQTCNLLLEITSEKLHTKILAYFAPC